ncbi:MAG: DUF4175 family protein [Gemmatimonadales bacterium]
MTVIERVRRTQRLLGAGALTKAIAWGTAATFGVLATLSFAALAIPALGRDAAWHLESSLAIGAIVAATLLWRARRLVSFDRVALWIEETIPELHYSLVTAIEHDRSEFSRGMEATVQRQNIGGVTRDAARRSIVPAIGAAILAGALLYVSPSAAFGGGSLFTRLGTSSRAGVIPAGSRLEKIEVEVVPPGYTGEGARTLDDPSSITGLTGSRIRVGGDGSSRGVTGSIGRSAVTVSGNDGGWTLSLTMPSKPAALTLRDRGYERLVVLDPRPDNPPKVGLTSPLRDTTLRAARPTVRLEATATDDIGLAGGYFEYLITTGSGEVFSARTITTPVVRFGGSRTGSLAMTLDLASLRLNQGDVVSIRAIVQDGNTLSGPGLGTSDTRTFRIARAGEYDSVAVDAAAPLPIDSSAMSQRMLIMMTEKLVREQKSLTRPELVKRSTEIGDMEDRIRKRVHEILFEIEAESEDASAPPDPTATLEAEEGPDAVRAVRNPDLLEAYNALWSAVRSLQIAEPAPALPPMRLALKALDRARLANRLYLRGVPPRVIVDLARVRLIGKEKGSSSTRTSRSPTDSAQLALERRFNEAIELMERQPSNAVRAFILLQVDALSVSPAFASALNETIDAFRKGRDATMPLLRARRALSGDPAGTAGLPSWSGGW